MPLVMLFYILGRNKTSLCKKSDILKTTKGFQGQHVSDKIWRGDKKLSLALEKTRRKEHEEKKK